ncbi:MAG: NAD(P)/FAD-dependent oxidoreductase [Eubacterium sp.]|nr:NAD(P)/FAD-dependent oxidoreductase [Eubacterium sp.]
MERYDIAVIGTGPGGLEAAITGRARNKTVAVFGTPGGSAKVEKAHRVDNYLGIPAVTGSELASRFMDHAKESGAEFISEKVTLVYPMGEYFSMQTSAGEMYEAVTVILAAGMNAGKTYPGEEKFLGRGVSYCATCDAALYKGKTAAIVSFTPEEEGEADFMAEYADRVLYFPQYKEEVHVNDGIEVIRDVPVSVEGDIVAQTLVCEDDIYDVDGVFFLRPFVAPANLLPGLEADERHVKVNRSMETNIPGCFACGDITGTPYQFIKAAGEGNVAALSAVSYIDNKRREKSSNS